jgi:diguanylate cyclase (GGDEF)-like protein
VRFLRRWGETPLLLTGIYLIFSALWIIGSDLLTLKLYPVQYPQVQTIKGLLFVSVSSALIYLLLSFLKRSSEKSSRILQKKEEELRSILDHLPEGILLLNDRGIILSASASALELLGRREEEVIGRSLYQLPFEEPLAFPYGTEPRDLFVVLSESPIRTGIVTRYRHPKGISTFFIRSYRLEEKGGECRILVRIEDLRYPLSREGERAEETLRNPLTQLPNREMFLHYLRLFLSHARSAQKACGVIWIDLDRFYEINQLLGRELGNTLLQEVAIRLKSALRTHDILGHIGGDKFLALVPDLPIGEDGEGGEEQKLLEVAERIRRALLPPFQLRNESLSITATMGISLYPRHHHDPEELLQQAETAAKIAKREKKSGGIQIFSPHLVENHREEFTLRQRMARALEEKEFSLYLQPIVDLKSGEWIGAEALLRWCPMGNEVRSAGEFLPLLMDQGLLPHLEEWVITQVVESLNRWQREGISLQLSFNLSAPFKTEALILKVLSELPPSLRSQVVVEFTENMLMSNPLQGYRLVEEITALGVLTALDDFGTGYSSLHRLKDLPIHFLKIDRLFIRNLPYETDLAIIQAILALGKNLGKTIIAEGIEKPSQWHHLKERGCALGQGFLFSPPLPQEEFLAKLKEKKKEKPFRTSDDVIR